MVSKYEKILHMICHQGNANWKNKIPLHTYQAAKIWNTDKYQLLAGMWINRNCHSLLVRMQNDTVTWEDSLVAFTKLNIPLPNDSTISVLGIYLKEVKTCPHKNLYMDIYSSFLHDGQNLEATKKSFRWWMDK